MFRSPVTSRVFVSSFTLLLFLSFLYRDIGDNGLVILLAVTLSCRFLPGLLDNPMLFVLLAGNKDN